MRIRKFASGKKIQIKLSKQEYVQLQRQGALNLGIKAASVTFSLSGSHNIAKPMSILDICFDITKFIHYRWKNQPQNMPLVKMDHIDLAEDSKYYEPTGNLVWRFGGEWYLNQTKFPVTPEFIKQVVDAYNQDRSDVQLQLIGIEHSHEDNYEAKIAVVHNETTEYPEPPELNIANGNYLDFSKLLTALGVNIDPQDYCGSISFDELKRVLSAVDSDPTMIEKYTRPSYDSREAPKPYSRDPFTGEQIDDGMSEPTEYDKQQWEQERQNQAHFIDCGLPAQQIRRYLNDLRRIMEWAEEYGMTDQEITFG
jgi:hypothetical protein